MLDQVRQLFLRYLPDWRSCLRQLFITILAILLSWVVTLGLLIGFTQYVIFIEQKETTGCPSLYTNPWTLRLSTDLLDHEYNDLSPLDTNSLSSSISRWLKLDSETMIIIDACFTHTENNRTKAESNNRMNEMELVIGFRLKYPSQCCMIKDCIDVFKRRLWLKSLSDDRLDNLMLLRKDGLYQNVKLLNTLIVVDDDDDSMKSCPTDFF